MVERKSKILINYKQKRKEGKIMENDDLRKATMAAHNPAGLIEDERRNNPNRHFYLYAKNHYQIDDVFHDMKVIQGNYCGMPPQYISDRDILNKLLSLAYLHIVVDEGSGFQQFVSFTLKFAGQPDIRWKIQACLSVLMTAEVKDIYYELGEPDPGILPLSSAPKASR
jgi:hypothetical protein